jgi:nicotinate-nucleotide adenylyltransferase
MKIGIYGGSFNPIHFGHTGLAKWVLEHTDIDEVWLMVSPNNPLKDKNILADEQERLAAAKQAIGDGLLAFGKRIIVSDFEFHLPRPTYTANTLRALVQEHPQHEFTLIIGEDNLQIFNKWRESEYILQNYRIFAYPRKGCSPYQVPQGKDIRVLYEAPYFDISSTELRKNLEV